MLGGAVLCQYFSESTKEKKVITSDFSLNSCHTFSTWGFFSFGGWKNNEEGCISVVSPAMSEISCYFLTKEYKRENFLPILFMLQKSNTYVGHRAHKHAHHAFWSQRWRVLPVYPSWGYQLFHTLVSGTLWCHSFPCTLPPTFLHHSS